MKPFFLFLLCIFSSLSAQAPLIEAPDHQKIGVQNAILAKVNGTSISMMDVKKKMDLLFHQNYPQLVDSTQAKFQFYQASWRHVLTDLLDHELILADATDKEVKLTDGEVREEMDKRFGPNVMATLDKIGLRYDEAWKLVKNDMIVQRMNWWFIHSKALVKATPQEIRQAYRLHLEENPSFVEWKYRVLTLKGPDLAQIADTIYPTILNAPFEKLGLILKEWETKYPSSALTLSDEYTAAENALAESHKNVLANLKPGNYSRPIIQLGRDKKEVCRIFYLHEKIDHPAPNFEELAPLLKNQLLQKNAAEIGEAYLGKLRSHYRFDSSYLKQQLPEDFQPFSIQ